MLVSLQNQNESLRGSFGVRRLQQDAAAAVDTANVTTVSTPQGLVDAVQSGSVDIVITEHLDLTAVPLLPSSICENGNCDSPLGEITGTRSIRVRPLCSKMHDCYETRKLYLDVHGDTAIAIRRTRHVLPWHALSRHCGKTACRPK